jgi:phosphatidylinositol dimannoside acyltransferase
MQLGEEPRRHESALLRRLALAGVRHGPSWFMRLGPQLIGTLFALALPEERRRVRAALRRVHGPRSPHVEERDVLRTFRDYAACLAEGMGADRLEAATAEVEVHGREHLNHVLARGSGAVLVTAHVGPWDAAARLLSSSLAAPLVIVMTAERNAQARALHDGLRQRAGVEVLAVGQTPFDALPLLRHLRRGGVAAFQLDRPAPSTRSLPARLFGRPFAVPEGPFRIAALARVPVLPLFAARSGYFSYRIEIGEPLECGARATDAELELVARHCVDKMQRFIAAHPTQWFHFGQA